MEEVIGEVEVELDGRFSSIRTKETNLGELQIQSLCKGQGQLVHLTKKLTFRQGKVVCCLQSYFRNETLNLFFLSHAQNNLTQAYQSCESGLEITFPLQRFWQRSGDQTKI